MKRCPSGHFCPLGTVEPFRCGKASICPRGSDREFVMDGFITIILIDLLLLAFIARSFLSSRLAASKRSRSWGY